MRDRTLILTGREIRKHATMPQAIKIVAAAFRAHAMGGTHMPAKIYLHLDKQRGDFRAMPAYIEGMSTCGLKWVNVHPLNSKYRLPSVMALIILNDVRTGYPLAIMDGTYITSLRTGAAGGIAARHLARKGSSRVGLVGSGVQASFQLAALDCLFNLQEVYIYDKDPSRSVRAASSAGKSYRFKVVSCPSIEECVRDKDIVVTTTPSRKPIIQSGWISPGTHINAIGADAKGKEELSPALLKNGLVFVDDITQALHSGEINVPISRKIIRPSDIRATLGEVICGMKAGRTADDQVTIFDSTGLAIQDVALAGHIYKAINASRKSGIHSIRF